MTEIFINKVINSGSLIKIFQSSFLFFSFFLINDVTAQVDQDLAKVYFREADNICQRDNGQLWGISLCGPMVFADARTRTLATNQKRPSEDLPQVFGYTNSPVQWGGSQWVTFIWDFTKALPTTKARQSLMLHELFHRIQPELGLMTLSGQNSHLDALEGRIWLRLEWRALSKSLNQSGKARKKTLRDAAAFRVKRRSLFEGAEENERVEEIREGLAQYTGTVASADSHAEAVGSMIEQLAAAENHETFLQQSYVSGTAYAILLDETVENWRRKVNSHSDLGKMVMEALKIRKTANLKAAAKRFGGTEVRASEMERQEKQQARMLELRNRYVNGPILIVPSGGGTTFNAVGAIPLLGVGTVYVLPYRTKGEWGTLESLKGILVKEDGKRQLPGPMRIEGDKLSGDGWTVTVGAGWIVRSGPRTGDYQIVRNP